MLNYNWTAKVSKLEQSLTIKTPRKCFKLQQQQKNSIQGG